MNTSVRLAVAIDVATRLALDLREVVELRKQVEQLERKCARHRRLGADYKKARPPFGSRASLQRKRDRSSRSPSPWLLCVVKGWKSGSSPSKGHAGANHRAPAGHVTGRAG